jgi:hypothetical protein
MLAERVSRGEGDKMPVRSIEGSGLLFTAEYLIEEAADERSSEGRSDSDC